MTNSRTAQAIGLSGAVLLLVAIAYAANPTSSFLIKTGDVSTGQHVFQTIRVTPTSAPDTGVTIEGDAYVESIGTAFKLFVDGAWAAPTSGLTVTAQDEAASLGLAPTLDFLGPRVTARMSSVTATVTLAGYTAQDESATLGDATSINLAGPGVVSTLAGGTHSVTVHGLSVKDEGSAQGDATSMNFVGAGVAASAVIGESSTVTIDAASPTGSAGSDLGGTYPNPSVAKIAGYSIDATQANNGQTFRYYDAKWQRSIDAATVNYIQQAHGAYSNLLVTRTGANTVNIVADYLAVSDSSNECQVLSTVNVTADISAAVGANGPDASGLDTANTWRYLYVIYNGTTAAALLSNSSTAPTMPSGYWLRRRVGAARNDGGSNFVKFYQQNRRVTTDRSAAGNLVLPAGGSGTTADVDASGACPVTARIAMMNFAAKITANTPTLGFNIIDKLSGKTVFAFEYQHFAGDSGITMPDYVEAPLSSAQVFRYNVTNAPYNTLDLYVIGYYDQL